MNVVQEYVTWRLAGNSFDRGDRCIPSKLEVLLHGRSREIIEAATGVDGASAFWTHNDRNVHIGPNSQTAFGPEQISRVVWAILNNPSCPDARLLAWFLLLHTVAYPDAFCEL